MTCLKPPVIIIPVPTTPVINAPFIPDVEFFIDDSINSFTFLEFTLTGDDKDAFLMTLKSYLVDPQNPLLNKDLPSGVKFIPESRKYRFKNQDISSYELKIVCHLTLDEKEVAKKEVKFKVDFVKREEIPVKNDTNAAESNSTENENDTNAD